LDIIKNKYDIIKNWKNLILIYRGITRQDPLNLLREIDDTEIQPLKEEYYVRVHLKDSFLFRYMPRRMSFVEKVQLKDITNDLLTRGIIKPSISLYCVCCVVWLMVKREYMLILDY